MKQMLTGNAAAAWGARLADVDYVPAFPITPQTEIIETISHWSNDRTMGCRFVMMDSEHAMVTAAGAAAATGVRVFTATSSQGLLYALEAMYTIAGWRVPLVMVNVSRGLSSPITLEADHNDILSARDTGFLQIHAETCQEVLDSIIMGYRIAEDPRVLLPLIINMDGFSLSFTREPVTIPDQDKIASFLPTYHPEHALFRASTPMSQGVAVLGGGAYSYFKYQMHLAAMNAIEVHNEIADLYGSLTGRHYGLVDSYKTEDANYVFVITNALATRGKAAVDHLRSQGRSVGLLRLRLIRPLPVEAIASKLQGKKGVIVIDQNIAPGLGGILFQELAAALYNTPHRPERMKSFVGGLGGKNISQDEFEYMLDAVSQDEYLWTDEPELLYTQAEWGQMRSMLTVAGKEVPDDNDL